MSWRWYKQVALPEGTVTMDVQDFVDLWARHPKEFWDAAVDFPDLTLRSLRIFLVAAAPKTWRSEAFGRLPWPGSSPKRWGVLFNAVQTEAIWSDKQTVPLIRVVGPEPDELVLQGAEAKRLARWRVTASMFEEGTTPGSKAVRTAVWSYMLDDDGSIPLVGGWPWFGSWDRDVESLRLAEDRLKCLHPMLLAISAWNENAAVFCDRLLPPYFQLKLRRGRFPTIGRKHRDLAS
jgi:hypothetical protein